MKQKVGVISLGCPKNLVDSEIMLGILEDEQYEITSKAEESDIIIVNTCGFIESARQESVNTILEMAGYKKDRCRTLIVTGCLAQRYRREILDEIPEVDAVVGTGSYKDIVKVIDETMAGNRPEVCGSLDDVSYLSGKRLVSTRNGYAYMKIAEGCDNFCTYCVIPALRGRYRSRKMKDLEAEAVLLAEKGVVELILTAQDTTRYGMDLTDGSSLTELVRKLSHIDGIERIRLLYCYPDEIDDILLEEMKTNSKLCKYLDIPIQHASDSVLRKMGRRGNSRDIGSLLAKAREMIPDIILRTSLIVGFPGEDEEDFKILTAFVKNQKFDRLGVFIYSREDDTPAALMKEQVPGKIKQNRYNTIMKLQQKIVKEKNMRRIGKIYSVLAEGVSDDGIFYYGRSYAEAPDIDGMIYFTSRQPVKTGTFVRVEILNIEHYDLIGEVVYESAE